MPLRTALLLLTAVLGAGSLLIAQAPEKAWDPKDEPLPRLDQWGVRRSVERGVPTIIVTPPPKTKSSACAIPLLPVQPRGDAKIRQARSGNLGIVRYAEPPAPACAN